MEYSSLFAERTRNLTPSPIRKLVPMIKQEGMISFGGGYPNDATFAFESLDVLFKSGKSFQVLEDQVADACQYGPTDCHPRLKPYLKIWHYEKDGWAPGDGQLQVLNGSQEGLHIMAYLFLNPGDSVAISEPVYPGALGAFRAFTDNFISYPIDEKGSCTNVLADILAKRRKNGQSMPKFIYEVPNGHNPAGVTLSLNRRKHLLEIAYEFDLIILEDDPYQLVQLEEIEPLPTLQSLDKRGQVIRLDSFSKIFAPGLRIGYATGPEGIIQMFRLYKQGTNLHVSSMIQVILAGYLEKHTPSVFRKLIKQNCEFYRENRDTMISKLKSVFSERVVFNTPSSGMFVWLQIQENIDSQKMIEDLSMNYKVLMVPGSAFSTTKGLNNCMRLSFSMITREQIEEGVNRLRKMIDEYLKSNL